MLRVIINSPSLDTAENVSGISAVVQFIVKYNTGCEYTHFILGKKDSDTRNLLWLWKILVSYSRWFRLMRTGKHAIVHFNLAIDLRSLVRDSPLIVISRMFGRRVIIHVHGGALLGARMPAWLQTIMKVALARGPIIALSDKEQATVRATLRNAVICVLPNCVGTEQAAVFERTYPKDEPLILLFLGRIAISKGIEVLYQALVECRKSGIRCHFVMAGTGPAEALYVPKFRELLGEDFHFSGVVSGSEKVDILKRCNAFVLPSFFEGLPMALLESMSFGLVPVTTAVGSIPSVITHGINGVLVTTHSSTEIVRAIRDLSTDRHYRQVLSQNTRRHLFETCSTEGYLKKLNEIYQND